MFTNFHILNIFNYIRTQKAQYWARITKSDMEIQSYNRLKAAIKRELNEVHFNSVERKQARRFSSTVRRGSSTQFKIGLAEKEKAGTLIKPISFDIPILEYSNTNLWGTSLIDEDGNCNWIKEKE